MRRFVLTRYERMALALKPEGRATPTPTEAPNLSETERQEVVRLARDGVSYSRIAHRFGTTRNAVAGLVHRSGYHAGRDRETRLAVRRFSWEQG